MQKYPLAKVFVPGGRPTVTYVSRAEKNMEDSVKNYLNMGHKILSVTGPTKTGKTVLLKQVLSGEPSRVWLSGGSIDAINDFWDLLAEELDLPTSITDGTTYLEQRGNSIDGGLKGGFLEVAGSTSESTSEQRSSTSTFATSPKRASRKVLEANPSIIVVVDDFHYIPQEVQLQIVRQIKDLVFEGVKFIFCSVPHRAYDVVKVEKEMTGRLAQVSVGFWSDSEITEIATRGFTALNVAGSDGLIKRLVDESYQSPLLMQEFCARICHFNEVSETVSESRVLKEPDWYDFFSAYAPDASKVAFEALARGPRERSDRKQRTLKRGGTVDIYSAILIAISDTGPLNSLTYEELRSALKRVLRDEDVPQRHEVVRVLEEMTKIARTKIDGEPVVDFEGGDIATLHISDPYFAYWLRWGSHRDDR